MADPAGTKTEAAEFVYTKTALGVQFEHKGKTWVQDEWCVCMGFDAMRICRGHPPKNFTEAEVRSWIGICADLAPTGKEPMTSSPSTPPEAPKPETDFETWWNERHYFNSERALARAAWQAAHTALSVRLAEVEQDCKDWRKQYEAARQETRNLEPYVDRAEAAEIKLADADAVIEEVFGDIPAPEDWCVPGKFGSTIQDALARHKARVAGKGTES